MGLISHDSVNNLLETPTDFEQTQQIGYADQTQETWQIQQQQQHLDHYQQVGGYTQWQTHQGGQDVPVQEEVQQMTEQQQQQQGGKLFLVESLFGGRERANSMYIKRKCTLQRRYEKIRFKIQ